MKLTQLKCPACNATLRVLKENSSIAVCDYCGLQYLIETDSGGVQWVHPQGQSTKNPQKETKKESPLQQENSSKDSIGKKIVSGVIFLIAILISFSSLIKPKVKKDFKEQVVENNSVTKSRKIWKYRII